ncbi:MAG: FAD-dependent oxidoreductase [Clostridia bacterium]|nr:FAD-dependent oxidoreductase [Clostridia bacterium]
MSRLEVTSTAKAERTARTLYDSLSRRISASPVGNCPVELTSAFLKLCLAQSCGKCVPCRVGLDRLSALVDGLLDGKGSRKTLDVIESTARAIADSSDCAIGFEAAKLVLDGMAAFRDDYISHLEKGRCTANFASVPCTVECPAHVDIPAYIALTGEGRYADAIRVIRKDNPFPAVCGLVCEHPCEHHCRRSTVDSAVNIRGLKRYAIDNAGVVPAPECAPATGKTVAVIGGGPAGLTAAYYLALMGHKVTVYEQRTRLGGMLRYGIPLYRLPDEYLDADIDVILSLGIEVKLGVKIGRDITLDELRRDYDSVYISIGAHADKKLRIDGEDADGVISAVELLGGIGDRQIPDFTGKNVVIVGGGNVAMDVTRTSMRLGAKSVKCLYRRRIEDMTALPEEIEGAIAEGCEIIPLMAPSYVAVENGKVKGLVVKPQVIGSYNRGRPMPYNANRPEITVDCDIIIVAIGQAIESKHFAESGAPLAWDQIDATKSGAVPGLDGVFSGGDCVSGPSTVIKAIEAGKVAAANIDEYLGFHTEIKLDVEVPVATYKFKPACGRVNNSEREADERKHDFALMEKPMTEEEAMQECSRCLRCDHYGCATLKGGRVNKW